MYGWQKRVAEPHVAVTVSEYFLCRVPQGLCHTVLSWATHQYTGIRYLSQHPPQLLKCLWIEGGSVSASSATQLQLLSSHSSIYIYLLVFEIWRNIYHLSQRMCVRVCVPLAPTSLNLSKSWSLAQMVTIVVIMTEVTTSRHMHDTIYR